MKKILLGFGFAVMLSACGTGKEPVVEAENTDGTSEQSLVDSEVVTEPEEVAVVTEPEPAVDPDLEPTAEPEPETDIPEDNSVVESKSSDMDFSICLQQQAAFAEAVSSSGNYNVIPIVDSNVLSIVKFCTNDDSVIHTCSAPDNKMIVTKSTNREGC